MRLFLLASSLLCAAAAPAAAQWQSNGNDIYFQGGKVGIGSVPTSGPWTGQLVVSATGSGGNALLADYPGGTAVTAKTGSGTGLYAFATSSSTVNYAVYAATSSPLGFAGYFYGGKNDFEGSVAVGGPPSPSAKLHITGAESNGMVLNADNQLYVNATQGFVGVDRNYRVSGAEVFGLYKGGNSWGGMYSAVSGAQGKPFYGYSAGGGQDAYHDYDGGTHQWLLWMGGTRLSLRGSDGFMQIYGNAGKPGGGSWTTTSDARLKRDVQDLDDSLERLLALRGVSFEYKDPEAVHELPGVQVGMLAQEVEQVFPDWVDEGEDGYKRLTFRGFEAVTVEALRELRAEKDAELAELRAENAALAARLARLEAALLGK